IALTGGANNGIVTPTLTGPTTTTVDVNTAECAVANSCRAQVFKSDGASQGKTLIGNQLIGGAGGVYPVTITAASTDKITATITKVSTHDTSEFASQVSVP